MNVTLLAYTPNPDKLIEIAARTCYQSYDKITDTSSTDMIKRLLKMKHESPLEHAYATFHIQDISRAASHQLVRHRLTAISQKSQRYVNESNFNYVIPDGVDKDKFKEDMDTIKGIYNRMIQEGAKKEDARAILPNACTTELILSANFRELRHIINVRSHHTAQSEIREVSNRMLSLLLDICKPAFEDLSGR